MDPIRLDHIHSLIKLIGNKWSKNKYKYRGNQN